ncbi:hypothetical protein J8V57_17225 [Xenorhabdus sp. PB61.4]|uniref:hypothetical protein n=1 Tax=Xenorhabdus sp. PB61.4 TaxID=2788940 RepID=UPI001E54DDE7|nr:hypothetical protein [Xenorhabdus sp. PB61.4]MCC8367984.1 hypothetical protein [Xenorhabdus sp. PB61.4]
MNNLPNDIEIAGFTLGYCDDGSAFLQKDGNGVSVRIDHLAEAFTKLYDEMNEQPHQP